MLKRWLGLWTLVWTFALAGCGGSGGNPTGLPGPDDPQPTAWQPPAGATPATGNYIYLQSETGDYIGAGSTHLYTQATAAVTATTDPGLFNVRVQGDESWSGNFKVKDSQARLEPGTYTDLTRYGFHDTAIGGLSWGGEGRGCNALNGWFVVDSVTYTGAAISAIELRFEQHCEGAVPALRGKVRWSSADTTTPPGPVSPAPSDLWQPAAGATPASGNYVYLESATGDYVGEGRTYIYTPTTAVLSVSGTGRSMRVTVEGNESWAGDLEAMSTVPTLQAGYYGNLRRHPFHNPAKGGLSWIGQGRGCNTLSGWFVVDSITYSGTAISAVELRFEQHCEGAVPALRGKVRWTSADTTTAGGPVNPPPNLWQPAAGAMPASGNYVYLESTAGDYIGAGQTYTYTPTTAALSLSNTDGLVRVGVTGDESWSGEFQTMNSLSTLQVGYYGDLERYPFHNPVKGGLSWSGEGRGCNTLTGWFVVDSVTYAGTAIAAIELRFEQHCEGAVPALRGKIRWTIADATTAPGPVSPAPADLWQPAAGATPASGNYVYLESATGDYIGGGGTYLYTPTTATLSVAAASGGLLQVNVEGVEFWSGDFQAMNTVSALQAGYYGDLQRYPFHNPVKGGLWWGGEGRGCNTLTGWFVIDSITYSGTAISAVELRFEQHCEGAVPALRGKIRWAAGG